MLNKLLRLFTRERDTIVFQLSQESLEVVALRQDEQEAQRLGDLCFTDILYSKRVPISKPNSKKVLDELSQQVRSLADEALSSRELLNADFNIRGAKIVCVLVAPLSVEVTQIYEAQSQKPIKITHKLLASVIADERVVSDGLQDAPKGHAVYADEIKKVELNGYITSKPLGRYASNVRVSVAKYLVEPKLWTAVGSVLESIFNREIRYIHSEQVVDTGSTTFCNEIYTVNELQTITNNIL
jgi:hypothetical protein